MHTPLVIERLLNAPSDRVWQAIAHRETMKKWYFELNDFELKLGFKFQFVGGTPEKQYLHLCEITQLEVGKKLAYSWRYDGYEGNSEVIFELLAQGADTLIKLSHTGLDSFPKSNPDLAIHNFVEGWTQLIGNALPVFLRLQDN